MEKMRRYNITCKEERNVIKKMPFGLGGHTIHNCCDQRRIVCKTI
jgi:hypothetical protein